MAGMLPGVEAARRRRVHQTSSSSSISSISSISNSSDGATTPRRPSLSLFSSNSSSTLSSSLVQQRSRPHHESADDDNDEKLGQLARQAKSRLDHRLRALTKSTTTTSTIERHVGVGVGVGEMRELTTHVYDGLNKKKKKGWWKKASGGWKGAEQRECAVCLEDFKLGDQLLNMPCAHTFHSNCLVPWLHTNTHCPCCRTSLFS